ncbi:MAG TPA: SCP2 sterol-binding domain-containing protein [Polyangiaceae bacterium]|nr:SCP2 sterol-binding domain-containing protein [Polyangiaceae bacterium]
MTQIALAPGAEDNGLAVMVADLLRQNLESKPHKVRDMKAISGRIAIVADDAEVSMTLRFDRGNLTVYDGIVGIPDVSVRASSDVILALSNLPLTRRFALPVPGLRDREGKKALADVLGAMRSGAMKVHGGALHASMMLHLTRVMSVNG